jgi:hypothetical protein
MGCSSNMMKSGVRSPAQVPLHVIEEVLDALEETESEIDSGETQKLKK